MTSTKPFDQHSIPGEQFLLMYAEGVEEYVNLDKFHEASELPVNAHHSHANAFALKFAGGINPLSGVLTPNLQATNPSTDVTYALWFFPPVPLNDLAYKSQRNLMLMVRSAYMHTLDAIVVETIPNPMLRGSIYSWHATCTSLTAMRRELSKAGNWTNTLAREFLSKGGASTSEAKRRTARENLLEANAAKMAKARENATTLVSLVQSGLTPTELAARSGISEKSAEQKIRRAIEIVEPKA